MPQAHKPLCLIHFWNWDISLFSLLALWGNKNWPPSMKLRVMENCLNKIGLKACKWSRLNGRGTQTPLCHPFLTSVEFPVLLYNVRTDKMWGIFGSKINILLTYSQHIIKTFPIYFIVPYFLNCCPTCYQHITNVSISSPLQNQCLINRLNSCSYVGRMFSGKNVDSILI